MTCFTVRIMGKLHKSLREYERNGVGRYWGLLDQRTRFNYYKERLDSRELPTVEAVPRYSMRNTLSWTSGMTWVLSNKESLFSCLVSHQQQCKE